MNFSLRGSVTLAAALLSLITAASQCHATVAGAQSLIMATVPQAVGPIKIDGDLSDWGDVRPTPFIPMDLSMETNLTPEALKFASIPHSAQIKACYDSSALYFAIEWKGPAPVASDKLGAADGLQIHVLTDRMAHFSIDPLTPNANPVTIRFNDDPESTTVSAAGAQSAVAVGADGQSFTQEIKLPWSLVTSTGQPPADGKIRFMMDFSWKDVTPSTVQAMPLLTLHSQKFISVAFLTAPSQPLDGSNYLPGSGAWGTLTFASSPAPNTTTEAPMASGATVSYSEPAAAAPVIDDNLSSWPAYSFQTISYAPGYLGNRYSGRIATQYDANNLYIALHVHTGYGVHNIEHQASQQGFWGGDAFQARFTDGKRTVNLCAWEDTIDHQPALTCDGKDLPNPFLLNLGAKEAIQADADGQGYVQEIALPWSALGFAPPQPGSSMKATFQIWWAGYNPLFTGYAEASLQPRGGIDYHYNLATEANVTIGIYDNQGQLLRWLTRGSHRAAGANVEYWDGLDQYGQPIPAGTYQVKGIAFPPIGLVYKLSVGNPGTPPWPTPDNKGDWIGDESSPQAAATDGNWVFLASPDCEKGWGVIAVDSHGQRQWGYQNPMSPRCVSLAVSGNYVYAFYSGPLLMDSSRRYNGHNGQGRDIVVCLDKRTGLPAQFSVENPTLTVETFPYLEQVSHLWDLRIHRNYSPANYGGQPRYFLSDIGETTNGLGIAATGGRIYLSNYYSDKIAVLDSATAKPIDTIPVSKPVGLYALANGKLLTVSGTRVLLIDPKTKSAKVVISTHLVAPFDVTTDSTGSIYVSDWGTSFQVKIFSTAGKFLRAIGTPGGRPWIGKWDPNGMLVPRGIAVTNAGKLWVAEEDGSPSRVSEWNAKTGTLVRDYIGPSAYGGGNWTWVNPHDPTMMLTEGAIFHLDYAKRTWTPVSIALRRMSDDQPFALVGSAGIPTARTVFHDGKTYMVTGDNSSITVQRLDGNVFTPVAAFGSLGIDTGDGTGVDDFDSDLSHHTYLNDRESFFSGRVGQYYEWSDLDGDGKVEENEMQWAPAATGRAPWPAGTFGSYENYWGAGVGPDGSIYFHTNLGKEDNVYRLDVDHWTADGAPVYKLANAVPIITNAYMPSMNGMYVTNANRLIVSYGEEWNPQPKNAIECYDRNGAYLWGIARWTGAQQIDDVAATNSSGDFAIPGVGDVVATWEWHLNQHSYLFTDDGLFISPLCDDNTVGPSQNWGESMRSFFQAPNGTPYLINGANDAYHILKITGLNEATRFNATMTLTDAEVQAGDAARVLAASSALATGPKPNIILNTFTAPPSIDGSLSDWKAATGVTLQSQDTRSASVILGRDATNLYLAYTVNGASLVNKGADWRDLFISGDCVDLMLSAGRSGPHTSPVLGDERLLFSLYNGSPVAVLYRPVSSDRSSPQILATSRFDQIIRLTSAKIAYQRGNGSYTIEASVPLADLGLDPASTTGLTGDVGVIFADQTGTNRSLRLYYYNQDTKMVDDLTTEANLQPGNWGPIDVIPQK